MKYTSGRREFLRFVTNQSFALSLSPAILSSVIGCAGQKRKETLQALKPSREDKLLLAEGLDYHIIAKAGEAINKDGLLFGTHNDFTCFLPLNTSNDEGLLWVNHEAVFPTLLHKKPAASLSRSKEEMSLEQQMVGGSILHLKKKSGKWERVFDSPYNRRLTGQSLIPFSGKTKIQGQATAVGTLANCSGGLTPWKSFLTSEENYDSFYGEAFWENGKRKVQRLNRFNWHKHYPFPPEHYGWIVEVDPKTGRAEKQVLLGRAPHEGATVVATPDKKAVVYMGEDREFGYIYKFVSTGMHFKEGTLYAADTKNGRWLPLDIQKSKVLQKKFKNQIDVLTYAHQAAEALGATPQDRPEDIEVHPQTGDVFIALTKNRQNSNYYGSLLKISEKKDFSSTTFEATTWLSGGPQSGVACPDNLCFDKNGNLWVTNDIPEKDMKKETYKNFGNNGLFFVPMNGPQAGMPIQVASAPVDAELTGPWFSPDYKTLFVSVQHPGAQTRNNIENPTSTWPDGPGQLPRSAVVALQGPFLDRALRP